MAMVLPSVTREGEVELPILDASEEGRDLLSRIDQDGPFGVTGIAHRYATIGKTRHLHAVAVPSTATALEPMRSLNSF
jgi:hypothetical protein